MKTECYVQTNIGAVRANNEDNYYCAGSWKKNLRTPTEELLQTPEGTSLLFGVFDGMGGEAGGEQASLLCAETLDEIGDRLLDYVLKVASGERTLAEQHERREISIFKDGVVL